MPTYRFFFLFMVLSFLPFHVFTGTVPHDLERKIDSLRLKMSIPGASIAVINKGKITWAKGFGYADIETKRRVNTETLFQAASITKTLTSAAVLKLIQEKGIALDEPVNRYLKTWSIPTNKFTKEVPVTFRLLLNHTAAMSNPYPDGGYGPQNTLPTLLEVLKGVGTATNPPLTVTRVPGTKYQYCNGCYAVLQAAMEEISKEPYPKLMQKLVFEPAQMTNSFFNNSMSIKNSLRIAIPYSPTQKPYLNAPTRNPIYSTGLLWTNAVDLAKFNILITKALNHSNKLISKHLAWKLITPSGNPTHGLGYFIGDKYADEKDDGHYIFHTGSNIGYLTLSIIDKEGKQGAVLLINISPKWDAKEYPQFEFIKKALKIIASQYHWR